ncbi:sporulation protein YpjB [Halobacillus massiliensis]|uniref:sporulation protein YpjB n=1 Tax=Halobacillus massiliensis TaxID=1926286 RepID=UPI0009E4BF69|nr:sporulation protein YpjB [Halobacillus massiliensis]
MGRAIAAVLLVMLVSILLCVQAAASTSPGQGKWDSFVTQYQFLIADNKIELADKMLNNRRAEMESYYEEKPKEQRILFEQLMAQTVEAPEDPGKFLTFLEVTANPEPELLLARKADSIQENVLKSKFIPEKNLAIWEQLVPTLSLYFNEGEVQDAAIAMNSYVNTETEDSQKIVVDSLEPITAASEEDLRYNTVVWTVILIGTSILLTLGYVSYRKYQAEKKRKKTHSKQRLNS